MDVKRISTCTLLFSKKGEKYIEWSRATDFSHQQGARTFRSLSMHIDAHKVFSIHLA